MVDSDGKVRVEVVYAEPGCLWSCQLALPAGATAREAVEASGLAADRPQVCVADDSLGVFGRRVRPQQVLRDGDRVEVYRPLAIDPMEARRRRALKRD